MKSIKIKEKSLRKNYPILEFDPEDGMIETDHDPDLPQIPERCVMSFFNDVLTDMHARGELEIIDYLTSENGPNPIYKTRNGQVEVAVVHPGVGAPLSAGFMDELIARGARKFIVCGGAGELDKRIARGHLIIPVAAIRDEGTSYHYLPPGREVGANPECVESLERTMKARGISYLLTKTWTTDSFFRETKKKIKLRKMEGCLTVEMEASALFAVAKFRNVIRAEVLYAGDDVSGDKWDRREWPGRGSIREGLIRISIEACANL
jgi:uridine phosphorylase